MATLRWVGALLCLGACASGPKPAPEAEPSGSGQAQREPQASSSDAMERHFADASAAKDAVIAGDLEGVRPALTRLSQDLGDEGLSEDWRAWLAEMRSAAEIGARSGSLAAAAEAVAAVGTTCGECHRTTRGGPDQPPASSYQPEGEQDLAAKMARHKYAAEALWSGLTGPVHQDWSNGARALMNINVPAVVTHRGEAGTSERAASGEGELQGKPDPALPAQDGAAGTPTADANAVDLDTQLRALRELGAQADKASIARDKQAVFAQMLMRCGQCHARLGVKP